MVCPNCGKQMEWSNIVIDTYPETYEAFCDCGCVIDSSEGNLSLCSMAKLTEEQKERVNSILVAKKPLNFAPTGQDLIG